MNEKSKSYLLKFWAILGLILLVVGVTYALFQVTLNGTKKVKLKTGALDVFIVDDNNNIELDGATSVPLLDKQGRELENGYKFSVVNNGTINAAYTLSLVEENDSNMDTTYINFYLKNVDDNVIMGPYNLDEVNSEIFSAGFITPDHTRNYELFIWLDKNTEYDDVKDKKYSAKVQVNAEQTNIRLAGVIPGSGKYVLDDKDVLHLYGPVLRNVIPEEQPELVEHSLPLYLVNFYGIDYWISRDYIEAYTDVEIDIHGEPNDLDETLARALLYDNKTLPVNSTENTINFGDSTITLEEFRNLSRTEFLGYLIAEYQDGTDYSMPTTFGSKENYDKMYNLALQTKPIKQVKFEEGITEIKEFNYGLIINVSLPSTVTKIGDEAFWHNTYGNISLNEGLKTIGKQAFKGCGFETITIPSTVTSIGDNAFADCSKLQEIIINNSKSNIDFDDTEYPNITITYMEGE